MLDRTSDFGGSLGTFFIENICIVLPSLKLSPVEGLLPVFVIENRNTICNENYRTIKLLGTDLLIRDLKCRVSCPRKTPINSVPYLTSQVFVLFCDVTPLTE